jgi:hypothetical protein
MNGLNNSRASNIKLVVNSMKYEALLAKVNAAKGKKADVIDIKPMPTVSGGNRASRKSPEKMSDKEFASWRRGQISKR